MHNQSKQEFNCYESLKHSLNIETNPDVVYKKLSDLKNENGNVCFEWLQYRNKKVLRKYWNLPCAFDIETTAGRLGSYMYMWQFSIAGICIYGRTWESFETLCRVLNAIFNLSEIQMICYIHNINYEYQFLRLRYKDNINKVFATKRRNVIYFSMFNIQFRDSYVLFGTRLEKVANDLTLFPFRKSHDLDYSQMRNSQTPLTHKELSYCLLDVITLSCAIFEKIKKHRYIYNIPLTKTGYVRTYLRDYLYRDKRYQNTIHTLTLTEEQYQQAKRAFCGGYSHGNYRHNGDTIYNALSFDECSEYPACELLYKYPMRFIKNTDSLNEKDIDDLKKGTICYIADFTFKNIRPRKNVVDNILSYHKCKIEGRAKINNGRVVCAEKLQMSGTNIDFEMIGKFYKWDGEPTIKNYNVYLCGYLPKSLLVGVIELFKKKNLLKGVKGEEENYKLNKENLNANYGAMVEDIVKCMYEFDNISGDLMIQDKQIEKQLNKYNLSNKRFNFYLWGVFITSYARRDIFYVFHDMKMRGISDCYLLTDTDSIKCKNNPIMFDIIKKHNQRKIDLLNTMIDTMHLEEYREILLTYKIGQFEIDDRYLCFKEFGAKRYIGITDKHELHCTVAGLPKKATEKMISKYGKYKTFEMIKKDVVFKPEMSCKLTHFYIDTTTSEIINGEEMSEYSGIILKDTTFKMSYSNEYEQFIDLYKHTNIEQIIDNY